MALVQNYIDTSFGGGYLNSNIDKVDVTLTGGDLPEARFFKEQPIDIHYWGGVKSRAQPIFYIAAYFGCSDRISMSTPGTIPYPGTPEWAKVKNKSAWGQLPFLTDGDIKVGQSTPICRYLVAKFGLHDGFSMADIAASEQALAGAFNFIDAASVAQYAPGGRTEAMDTAHAEGGSIYKNFAALESLIAPSGWFGSRATPGCAAVAAAVEMATVLDAEAMAKFPKLVALGAAVGTSTAIKAVVAATPYPYYKRKSDPVESSA